jgi:hypothetical protein
VSANDFLVHYSLSTAQLSTAIRSIGVSAECAALAFQQFAAAMHRCDKEWLAFFEFCDTYLERRYPWYNRLRWRLDAWVRQYCCLISTTRASRRLRVWVEHTVRELEGT